MTPSDCLDLLRQLKGRKILRATRLLRGSEERFLSDFPRLARSQLFASTGFAFFLEVEALGWLAFVESERDNSIAIRQLQDLPIIELGHDVEDVDRRALVECVDPVRSEPFWSGLVDANIREVTIITVAHDRESVRPFRNERGLSLLCDHGELIIQVSLAAKGVPGGLNLIRPSQVRAELQADLCFQRL